MPDQKLQFSTETQEAEWWADNQESIAEYFEQAKPVGELRKGTVARVASIRANVAGVPPARTRITG